MFILIYYFKKVLLKKELKSWNTYKFDRNKNLSHCTKIHCM